MKPPSLSIAIELALKSFRLELNLEFQGNVLGVWGPSGAGKSSLIEVIAGLNRQAKGRIAFGDICWQDSAQGQFIAPERRRIGYVPQAQWLFPHRSVIDNLLFGAHSTRGPLLEELCTLLELTPLLDRSVQQLSGGEKQRVALGRALNNQPRLLLLDEPITALDISLRRKILPYLLAIKARFQLPIILITHDPVELVALCDRVVQLEQGSLRHYGSPADILNAPEYYLSKQRSDFENILHAEVIEHSAHNTRLHYQGTTLLMPKASAAVGEKIYLSLPARELIIARQPSDQLSARNQIPARIVQQHLDRPVALLELATECQHSTLFAEITLDASQQLELKIDDPVWIIFKSSSLTACS
jgi:molybdate transport system ATP-binding protein